MADTIVKGISIKFAVDDVEFDQSIDSINKSLKTLKNQVKSYNKELKIDPSNADVLKKKLENLSKQEELLKKQLKGYKDELENLSDADIESHSTKWQTLKDKIDQTQKSLEYVTKEEEKIKNMNPAILGLGKSFNDLSKNLKQAADDTKALSVAGAAATTAIVKMTGDAAAAADDINTLAAQYNLSTKEIQQFGLAADLIDVDLNTITKSFAKLTKNMTSSSKEVTGAFKTLGIEVKDSNGDLRSSNEVFYETIAALAKIENETEQDSLAMAIFGKSAADLGPLINGGAEQLEEFNKYLEDNALLLSQDELDSLNEYNDAIDTIKATLKAFTQKIAVTYAPMFQKVVEKIQQVVLRLKQTWEGLSPQLKELIPIVAAILAALAPVLLIASKVTGAIGAITTALGGGAGLTGILGALTSPVAIVVAALGVLYAVSEDFRKSVKDLVQSLMTNIKPAIEAIKGLIDTLIAKFNEVVLPILQALGTFIGTYIVPIIKDVAEVVLPIVTDAITVVSDTIGWLFDRLGDLWTYLEDTGAIDAFGKAFDAIKQFIENFIDAIKRAYQWVKNLIDKFKDWLNLRGEDEDAQYTSYGRRITPRDNGSGGLGISSGGLSLTTNINVSNNGQPISETTIRNWGETITDVVSENLGRRWN